MRYIKEEQARTSTLMHLLLLVLIQKNGLWHTLLMTLGMGLLFCQSNSTGSPSSGWLEKS